MTSEGRVSSVERDGCGCLIAWEKLPNGHRVGITVEACPKHPAVEDFDPADFVEVERP